MNVEIDELLTTTRSARKTLDLDAPVEPSAIRECLAIAMQAANGSNQQSWRWLVVSDAALREKVAALYRDAYLQRVGGALIADLLPADTPGAQADVVDRVAGREPGEGAAAGHRLLRAVHPSSRRGRLVLRGDALWLDLPGSMELSARAA